VSSPAQHPDPEASSNPPHPHAHHPDRGISRKPLEDFIGRTVAIATIAGFIAQGFGAELRTTGVVFVVTFLAAYPLQRFLRRSAALREHLQSLPLSLPIIIAIALTFTLAGMVIRQRYMIDRYSVDVGELADSYHWKVLLCEHNETCIASAISSLQQQLPSKNDTPPEHLFTDQALGEILRTSPESMDLLWRVYGAKEGFLGTGLSKPLDQQTFVAGRIPEYLVPNYPETDGRVLVWKLEPRIEYAHKKLSDVLNTEPDNAKRWKWPADVTKATTDAMRQQLAWNADLPAVVRFALIPKGRYSGCLGRQQAHEVFVSHLGLMLSNGLTVEQATGMSGYPLPMEGDDELYAFVFVPSPGELNEPTWTHMISKLPSEIASPGRCPKTPPTPPN
jgi:hypothetical protein